MSSGDGAGPFLFAIFMALLVLLISLNHESVKESKPDLLAQCQAELATTKRLLDMHIEAQR